QVADAGLEGFVQQLGDHHSLGGQVDRRGVGRDVLDAATFDGDRAEEVEAADDVAARGGRVDAGADGRGGADDVLIGHEHRIFVRQARVGAREVGGALARSGAQVQGEVVVAVLLVEVRVVGVVQV